MRKKAATAKWMTRKWSSRWRNKKMSNGSALIRFYTMGINAKIITQTPHTIEWNEFDVIISESETKQHNFQPTTDNWDENQMKQKNEEKKTEL